MAFRKLIVHFNDPYLEQQWYELQNRIADAGGFTPGGDLGGTDVAQIVEAIRTMPTPAANTASPFDFLRVSAGSGLASPRSCVSSGGLVWIGEHVQDGAIGSGIVTVMAAATMLVVAAIDLAAALPSVDENGVRDMAQDDNYVYCACWQTGNIAIISKASQAVVGWGAVPGFGLPGRQVVSVCADNLGNFYGCGNQSDETRRIWRFTVASCLGAAPDTVGPAASAIVTYGARKIRYGAGALFLANGGKGDPDMLHRVSPATLAQTGAFASANPSQFGMDCLVAFGSVWVTQNVKTEQGVFRVDPTTLAQQAFIDTSDIVRANINCLGAGPDANGAPNARLLVTNVDTSQDMIVIDPGTNTIQTTVAIPNVGAEQVCSSGNRFFVASPLAGGPNAGEYGIEGAAGAYSIVTQPLRLIYDSGATRLPYSYGCPFGSPWSDPAPTTVGAAIDWIATAVSGLLGGPIPPCGAA
jgi:hypothetical protein